MLSASLIPRRIDYSQNLLHTRASTSHTITPQKKGGARPPRDALVCASLALSHSSFAVCKSRTGHAALLYAHASLLLSLSLSLFPIYSVQVPTTYKLSRAALRRLRCSLIRGQSAWRSRWPRPSGQTRTGCRRGCRRRCASPGARSHTASRSRRARGGRA